MAALAPGDGQAPGDDVVANPARARIPLAPGLDGDEGGATALELALVPGSPGLSGCDVSESVWFQRCGACFMSECESCGQQVSVCDFRVARVAPQGEGQTEHRVLCPACAAALEQAACQQECAEGRSSAARGGASGWVPFLMMRPERRSPTSSPTLPLSSPHWLTRRRTGDEDEDADAHSRGGRNTSPTSCTAPLSDADGEEPPAPAPRSRSRPESPSREVAGTPGGRPRSGGNPSRQPFLSFAPLAQ